MKGSWAFQMTVSPLAELFQMFALVLLSSLTENHYHNFFSSLLDFDFRFYFFPKFITSDSITQLLVSYL